MVNGITLQLTITIKRLELHRGMVQVFMEKKQLMEKFLIKIKNSCSSQNTSNAIDSKGNKP